MRYLKFCSIISLFILFTSSSCEKRLTCSRNWSFEVPVNIIDKRDFYLLGDTLLFESVFDMNYTDLTTGDIVMMDDFPFNIGFMLVKINENPWSWANQAFELIQYENQIYFEGIPTNNRLGRAGAYMSSYATEGHLNSLKFGLICLKSGVFTIEFFARAESDRISGGANFSKNCDDYISPFQFRMNDHSENGFSLYNGSIDTTLRSVSEDVYKKVGAYSFIVE